MRRPNAQVVVMGLAVLLGMAAVSWAWGFMSDCREGAAIAAAEAGECQALAARIRSFGSAGAPVAGPVELTGAISAAAAAAGLPQGSLQRIEPGPVRRRADGAAMERPVEISIDSATMEQAFVFLHGLASGPSGLSVSDLTFKTPGASTSDADRWEVQTTVVGPVVGPVASAEKP